jgi:large subunit ribosomal protein L4
MVRYQLLKRQSGTHLARDRSMVSGTGAKMYRQKGTGRARHGDKKAPQFRGGGKAFGPKPRSHAIDLPKKIRALAMRHALSSKAREDALLVLERAEVDAPKTKDLHAKLDKLGLANALIVSGAEVQDDFAKAARNIPNIDVLPVQGLNVYDILRRDRLVLTKDAITALEARFK